VTNSTSPLRTIVYIDGFNLYYGLKRKYGKKYMWLNIDEFARNIAPPQGILVQTKYFTSRLKGNSTNPEKLRRQAQFLRAVKTLYPNVVIIEGTYQSFPSHCKHCDNLVLCSYCGTPHVKPNEKKTDVNIATSMLVDVFEDNCDVQILVSGDSDYEFTLQELRRMFPEKEMIVAFPPMRRNNQLIGNDKCTSFFDIPEESFSGAQFPDRILIDRKKPIEKPSEWV
jgi:uncharacterized LabA/DUF88 family protein